MIPADSYSGDSIGTWVLLYYVRQDVNCRREAKVACWEFNGASNIEKNLFWALDMQ